MKMIRLFLIMVFALLMWGGVIQAQGRVACTISTTPPEDGAGVYSISFRRDTATLVLPDSITVLSCSSSPEAIALIDTSPSAPLNSNLPRPTNPIGLAESQTGYAIVNTGAANLRTGPDVGFTRVAIVDGGTRLVILGRNAGSTWWLAQAGDLRGWIWGEALVLRGDLTNVPFVESVGEIIQPTLYVGFTGNPIFDTLDAGGEVICNILGRLEYPILGRSFNSGWYLIEVTCPDATVATGWILATNGVVRNPAGVAIPVIR